MVGMYYSRLMLSRFLSRLLLALLLITCKCRANFLEGDFIPTSRKGLFHGERTQWHDVLGAHCPRFGISSVVAMPIPQPIGFQEVDDYRIQLSLDGDRLVTPWLQILGRRAPPVPYLLVELVRSGDALVDISAQVQPLPPSTVAHYRHRAAAFANSTHWPKHLTVRYTWRARHEVDVGRGLTVMFAAGAAAMLAVAGSVARAYQRQLRQFVEDVTGDEGFAAASEKAD